MTEGRKRRGSRKPLLYFFLDGKLYKKLRVVRPADIIECWDFEERKMAKFIYSHVLKSYEPAYSTSQAGKMVQRDEKMLLRYIYAKAIPAPYMAYTLDGKFNSLGYKWSKQDVLRLHDYMLTVHRGHPRKDGGVTPQAMPTRSELRALMEHNVTYYVQEGDGEIIKTFRQGAW